MKLIWAVVIAFAIAIAMGPFVIPWLHKMKFGQTVYNLGPESHKAKTGTPTMGGVIFAVPAIIVPLCLAYNDTRWDWLIMALISTIGFGAVGFVDDWIKVSKKRSLGLTPMQKIIPQVVLSLGLAIWAYCKPEIGSKWVIPFTNAEWDLGWFFIPAMVFVLVGTVNSANLLDGLDGLLGSCSAVDFATLSVITLLLANGTDGALSSNYMNLSLLCCACLGGVLGFLYFNSHPAKVFMGDIGAFVIGGAVAGVALTSRLTLYLPIIAFAMLVSSASDIIQIGYFKLTHGKRVFRMAPLHHHFELGGMKETKVVSMYTIGTVILCLIALLGFVKA